MNVKEVQRRLWEQSHQHKQHRESGTPLFPVDQYDDRLRNLMDLIHQPQWLRAAAVRVLRRSHGKAPGVDGVTTRQFRKGLSGKVENLRLELKRGTYQPQPLKRVMIPKSNGKMRALGIPCLRDKIVQEAIRMALEPVFEVEFHDNSYGFRPNRNTHHAVFRCQHLMRSGFSWVIEGDVKACFDEISHQSILRAVREKVMDNKFLDLLRRFLKSGVKVGDVVMPTEKGVPQGGVISPLLANAVLNKLDWFLHHKGTYGNEQHRASRFRQPNVRFVRYADDWCVFVTRASRQYAEGLRDQIRDFLRHECGLELSAEKTHVTHVRDGFDFLSFHLNRTTGQRGKDVPKIKVSQKALANVKQRLHDAMRNRPHQESVALRIKRGSAVVRGWSEYFRIAHNFTDLAGTLDHHALWIALKAICRKNDIPTGRAMKRFYRDGKIHIDEFCELEQFSKFSLKLDYRGPEPYEPGEGEYESEDDLEAAFARFNERQRFGSLDVKFLTLRRDGYRCCACGRKVTNETSQVDHIVPVKRFASFAMASFDDNLQTLCLDCHKEKHHAHAS
ncbi:MAG: group II intron reverse transcriptase/maturase [Phycisphaeraceae bacterium]|nr:group II intron reverse transcriptase/maturase [Phycisphaeraceae bacterium]